MKNFDIDKVFDAYIGLSNKLRKDLILWLNSHNLPIAKIEACTYLEVPGIKHFSFILKILMKQLHIIF